MWPRRRAYRWGVAAKGGGRGATAHPTTLFPSARPNRCSLPHAAARPWRARRGDRAAAGRRDARRGPGRDPRLLRSSRRRVVADASDAARPDVRPADRRLDGRGRVQRRSVGRAQHRAAPARRRREDGHRRRQRADADRAVQRGVVGAPAERRRRPDRPVRLHRAHVADAGRRLHGVDDPGWLDGADDDHAGGVVVGFLGRARCSTRRTCPTAPRGSDARCPCSAWPCCSARWC